MDNNFKTSLSCRYFISFFMMVMWLLPLDQSEANQQPKLKSKNKVLFLLSKLKKRDELIADLLIRVENLEKKLNEVIKVSGQLPGNVALITAPESAPAPGGSSPNAALTPPSEQSAPGQFKVDEQASQRALERTLAKSGVLLLPTGYLDVDVNFDYSHREDQQLITITDALTTTENSYLARSRRNIFAPSLAFRLGLPFDTQLELSVPYRFVSQSNIVSGLVGDVNSDGSGFGDVQVGIAKTLLQEAAWWPDLVARVNWNHDTGKNEDGGVSLGGGIQSITGSLSLLKRQDPLAFFLNSSYTHSFTVNNYMLDVNGQLASYNPGNILGFNFGTQLAASSDTSLSLALNQLFISNSELGSRTLAGSDRNVSLLTLGASSIISRNVFVNLSVGMGLTHDAPDYTAGISISNRTNLKPILGLD